MVPLSYQLTELHDQEVGDTLAALAQTLQDVGVLQAPGRAGQSRRERGEPVLAE